MIEFRLSVNMFFQLYLVWVELSSGVYGIGCVKFLTQHAAKTSEVPNITPTGLRTRSLLVSTQIVKKHPSK